MHVLPPNKALNPLELEYIHEVAFEKGSRASSHSFQETVSHPQGGAKYYNIKSPYIFQIKTMADYRKTMAFKSKIY